MKIATYYMGGGILPTAIFKGKLYFLFGRENKYEDSAPGFSDFGGGTDDSESFFDTAVREATEELTGFLGNQADIRRMLRRTGTYPINLVPTDPKHKPYRMYIFPYEYNELLPQYYNNNQRFLQAHLDTHVIKHSKIFEKAEIRWICVDQLARMRPKFRSYFRAIVDDILQQQDDIKAFIAKRRHTHTRRRRV
jgi:8-oxo-dGTP pyrophosphatase MutT (NUDIX family)